MPGMEPVCRELWQDVRVSLQQIAPHGAGANHGPDTYSTYREAHQACEGIGAWDPTEVSITEGSC